MLWLVLAAKLISAGKKRCIQVAIYSKVQVAIAITYATCSCEPAREFSTLQRYVHGICDHDEWHGWALILQAINTLHQKRLSKCRPTQATFFLCTDTMEYHKLFDTPVHVHMYVVTMMNARLWWWYSLRVYDKLRFYPCKNFVQNVTQVRFFHQLVREFLNWEKFC